MSPRERAAACYAQAEATDHPRDKAALRAAAAAWDRIAGPRVAWSTKDLSRDLTCLKRDVAMANGPFKTPKPPRAPSPAAINITVRRGETVKQLTDRIEEAATIQF